jgi:hypothetical protein
MSTTAPRRVQGRAALQILFVVIFAALVGGVVAYKLVTAPPDDPEPLSPKEALGSHGFYLKEVSKQCKIDFTHEAPANLDGRLERILPIIASMGASVAVGDFNKDGLPDLYVVTSREGGKNRLYRNNGDGTFTDVAAQMGVADLNRKGTGVCMGALWGDFDNDGYEDLLVYRWGRPELFHNDKGKGFTRVTDQAHLPRWVNANSACWLDYDRDGNLDLFLAGYWHEDVNLWKLETTKIMPSSFEYANNGGRKYLLRNLGKGKDGKWLGFQDVTARVGIDSRRWTLSAAAADLRGTGYPDLVLANDYGINEHYANQGGKRFVEVGKKTGIGDRPKSGMSVSFGDVYNRGQFCVYTTNITEPGVLLQWNNLWVPVPGEEGEQVRYENRADDLGVARGGWSWGAQFGDLNNDGLLDLVLTNGYVSADRRETYWYQYSRIAGAFEGIIIDAANWPAMGNRSLGGYQRHCLWLNRDGKFDEVAAAVGFGDTHDGRAVALVDLWNRGVLDVVEANQKGPLLVYKNTVASDRDWIQFKLEGTRSNRSAIGAQVRVYWDDKVQVQEVSGGSGYAAQNQRRLHFGLGTKARIDRIEIRWPSDRPTQVIRRADFARLRIGLRQVNHIVEPK